MISLRMGVGSDWMYVLEEESPDCISVRNEPFQAFRFDQSWVRHSFCLPFLLPVNGVLLCGQFPMIYH